MRRIDCDKWTRNGSGRLKRFIRYLYEYEQGRRIRNVGFVKVEQSDSECILHIHGKGLRSGGRQKLRLYLFYEDGNECIGIWQGEMDAMNPAINYQLRYTPEDTGVPENYPRIEGIIMENDGHRKYAAVWDDMPVDIGNMREWNPESEQDETPAQQQMPEEMVPERQMPEQDDPTPEVPRTVVIDEDDRGPILPRREEEEERRSERREENSDFLEFRREREEEREPERREREEDADVQFRREREENERSIEVSASRPWKVTKIQRKDLARLPRCEWRLSNNSFLLHGYYNYRHLVLIQDGSRMRLGVPGIYHENEAKAAGAFGFPEFISADSVDITLSQEECNEEEKFGYWCRQVRYIF